MWKDKMIQQLNKTQDREIERSLIDNKINTFYKIYNNLENMKY